MSGEHHSQYWDYVHKFIPPQNLALLDVVLDDGDDGERDLLEIAQYITKWEEKLVGPLRLTREEVDTINEVSKPELKRRNVLRVWKDNEGLRATYGCLLDRCLQGKDNRTAQKICEILKQKSSSGHDKSSGEPDDDDDVSITLVKKNLAKIKESFATLVTKVTTSLMTKNIDMNVFRLYITTRFPPGDIISHSSNVAEVCQAISHHQLWDFSSYSPVEEIVKNFGVDDPELSGWIKEYKSELAGFKAVTKIAHYIEACSDDEDMADSEQSLQQHIARYDKRYCHKLSVKLKPARVTEKSLDYIDALWRSIADYLYLPSLSVLLETIKEGCVEVTWLVPTLSALQVETNIQDSGEFMKKMEITLVILDGKVLYINEGVEMRLENVEVLQGMEMRLLGACERGQVDEVMTILTYKVDVDTADPEDGTTPLLLAARTGNCELAEVLLKHHACIDKQDQAGYTPLMMAVSNHQLDMISLLLEYSADVNITSKNGWTAMKLACDCTHGSLDTVKLLIERGANINAWSKGSGAFYWTPLTFAANEGHLEICQLLLDHGALVDIPNV